VWVFEAVAAVAILSALAVVVQGAVVEWEVCVEGVQEDLSYLSSPEGSVLHSQEPQCESEQVVELVD